MHALIPACCGSFLQQPSASARLRGQESNGPRHRNGDDASPAAHVGCRQRAHSRIALVRAAAKAAGRNGCLRRLFTSSNTARAPLRCVPRPITAAMKLNVFVHVLLAIKQGLGILVHGMQ